jgi:hypothetical protein
MLLEELAHIRHESFLKWQPGCLQSLHPQGLLELGVEQQVVRAGWVAQGELKLLRLELEDLWALDMLWLLSVGERLLIV